MGSPGRLEQDKVLPFSHELHNFISIKKPTLPETSFELLREVEPEVASLAPPSPMEQNGNNRYDEGQPVCKDYENVDRLRLTTDGAHLHEESLVAVANKTDKGNIQDTSEPTPSLLQPIISDSGYCNRPQEDVIDAATAFGGCSITQTEPTHLPEQDVADHTAMVEEQSCGSKSPNTHQCNDVKRLSDDDASSWSSKNPIHEGATIQATITATLGSGDAALPRNISGASHLPELIVAGGTSVIQQPHSSRTYLHSPRYDSGEKVNQNLEDGSASIQPKEKDSDHEGLTMQVTGALVSGSCNIVLQGDKSEINCQPEKNIVEHTKIVEQRNGKKDSCRSGSVPKSSQDSDGKRANQAPNKKSLETNLAETSNEHSSHDVFSDSTAAHHLLLAENFPLFHSQDQGTNHSIGDLAEPDLCVKCGKEGQLLKCGGGCLLAGHESCFGSSVVFDDSGQFYCPLCFYTKAVAAYQKAKKTLYQARNNLSTFLGNKQVGKHHTKQPTGVQLRAANHKGHLNGHKSSKRQGCHQAEGANVSHQDEEPDQQMKQKTNDGNDASCYGKKTTEKAVDRVASSVRDSDITPMNKERVLQDNTEQVQPAEHEQPAERKADEEVGNSNSAHEQRHSSHSRCDTSAAHQEDEAGKRDGPTNSQQSEGSEDIEASSSNDTVKRPRPPWHNTRNCKARLQEKEEAFGHQNQHVPSPSKKRNYAYPPKRYSNPLAPPGRRRPLLWTEEEEGALREAMTQFTPQDNGPIPWVEILEYGRDVFHGTRRPSDLRVKWRNMQKKQNM